MGRSGSRPGHEVVAIRTEHPLPPGFTALPCEGDPCRSAVAQAMEGADPGLVLHRTLAARCDMAFVFAPDRPIDDATLLNLACRTVHSALSGLAPVRVPVEVSGRSRVTVNGGEVANIRVYRPAGDPRGIPDWLVLGIDVAVDLQETNPGANPGSTCLREEGFDASRRRRHGNDLPSHAGRDRFVARNGGAGMNRPARP